MLKIKQIIISYKVIQKKSCGFTMVEMLMYVGLMAVITLAISQSLVVVLKSNRVSFVEANIRNSGYYAMEGMLREIYLSESIDQASSGILQMKQSAGTKIVKFATSSDPTLNFYEGAVTPIFVGPLTSRGTVVKNLIFNQINTGKSLAVKIEMELQSDTLGISKSEWFYTTAILRGSY